MDGRLLKKELDELGLRYGHVAEKTAIPYSSLMPYLRGERPMPEAKFLLVCLIFKIDQKKFTFDDLNKGHCAGGRPPNVLLIHS